MENTNKGNKKKKEEEINQHMDRKDRKILKSDEYCKEYMIINDKIPKKYESSVMAAKMKQ